ncbi:MAG: hypothetical protein AAF329_00450 [Cyanobacteria bacterium P01_A01_bin.17]
MDAIAQRLASMGISPDLAQVTGADAEALAQRAVAAREQAQQAAVYVRAGLSVLKSNLRVAQARASLYVEGSKLLGDADKKTLKSVEASAKHAGHMAGIQQRTEQILEVEGLRSKYNLEAGQAKHLARLRQIEAGHRNTLRAAARPPTERRHRFSLFG